MTVQGNPARIKELEKELDALRAVGRAIVELDDQSQILNRIAREAARVVRARAASILLDHVDHLEVAGAYRLGARYKATLENPPPANVAYRGPASIVTQTKQHFLVSKVPCSVPLTCIARHPVRGWTGTCRCL